MRGAGSTRVVWVVWGLVATSLVVALTATLWFIAATLTVRLPYWGEAEVVFEASRLRAHLPLYVDPLAGAHEYGAPPSRYFVTYPPVWTWVVSLIPEAAALLTARLASTAAWLGALAALAFTARRESRREAIAAAAFVAGIWVLTNFAMIGRPDAVACALAALALARAIRAGRLDLVGVGLLVVVPWVKPTLIGLPLGALIGAALVERARAWRLLGFAALCAVTTAAVGHVASGGALFVHVVRSNAQPFTLAVWLEQVPARLPFFAPLFAWAACVGWRDRASAGSRIGLAALAGAVLWTLTALAKTGSSSNYWMEPCIAAVALIARAAPGPIRFGSGPLVHAAGALAAVLWADVASVRGAVEHAARMRAQSVFVGSIRARERLAPEDVVAADEAGIELALNHRILTPAYQTVYLVRRGTYPATLWIEDLSSASLFVEHTGQLRLAPEVQRALEERFVLTTEEAGFKLWRRR